MHHTLAVPMFREHSQRGDLEALGCREVATPTTGIVGSTNLQDVRGVAAGGDVEVGHAGMVMYFPYARHSISTDIHRGEHVSRVACVE